MKTVIADSRELLHQIERILLQAGSASKEAPLEQVVDILFRKRRYSSIGIYAVIGQTTGLSYVPLAYRGPVLPCLEVAMGKSRVESVAQTGHSAVSQLQLRFESTEAKLIGEVAVPVKVAGRVLGVIDVESERISGSGYHDQVLLKRVASLLARYFTSNGRAVLQKLRIARLSSASPKLHNAGQGEIQQKAAPASDRAVSSRKAIAGETLHA